MRNRMQKTMTIAAVSLLCTICGTWLLHTWHGCVHIIKEAQESNPQHDHTDRTSSVKEQFNSQPKSDKADVITSDLKFLDVMWPFLPERYQKMIEEAKTHGGLHVPETYTDISGYVGILGHIVDSGKLMDFYKALKIAYANDPNNLNLLRMLVRVSAVHGFDEKEYEANLKRLVKVDLNADVVLPCARLVLREGNADSAYGMIERGMEAHPEQSSAMLTSALRMFTAAKALKQQASVIDQLKNIDLDAAQVDSCGGVLYDDGDYGNARVFYARSTDDMQNPFFREIARVRICQIDVKTGVHDEQTIETLKELSSNSDIPAIKADARRVLLALNITPPGDETISTNQQTKGN